MRSIILALALIAAPAAAAPSDDLRAVLHAHWAAYLRNNPVQATTLGVRTHDAEIGDPSLEQADREAGQANAFLERLRAIPDAGHGKNSLAPARIDVRMRLRRSPGAAVSPAMKSTAAVVPANSS